MNSAIVPPESFTSTVDSTPAPVCVDLAIETRDLSLWYGQNQVLDSVSLGVPAQSITALIGRSGSGKSSLLRCLNRLIDEYPDARCTGQVRIAGVDARSPDLDAHDLRRRVGMVFDRPNPFPMSVFDNVAFGLRLLGLKRRNELDGPVEAALRAVGLWDEVADLLDESALKLSLGQQQRLVIARAIAIEPEVLLMDEPTAALDPISTLRFEELVQTLAQRFTILLVTHNLQQAVRVSQFTGFVDQGKLVEFGETNTLFTHPRERRTEDYITGRFG